MNDDGAFVTIGSITDAAAIAVALQNRFTQTAEILLILPFQRVAGRAESQGQDQGLGIPQGRYITL